MPAKQIVNQTETKHTPTPGPWRAIATPKDGFYLVDRQGHNLLYAIPEAEANARVMAAAPKVLAALKSIVAMYGPSSEYDGRAKAAWEGAEAAIATAEGRTK